MFEETFKNLAENAIFDKLSEVQKQAVTYIDGPLLIHAGAGSGKTRVITHKIAWLIDEKISRPEKIVALTFTNKAAREMQNRIATLVPSNKNKAWAGTFHSYGLNLLYRNMKETCDYASVDPNFTISDSYSSWKIMAKAAKDILGRSDKDTMKGIQENIQKINLSWNPEGKMPVIPEIYLRIIAEYKKQLRINNMLDYDDLMIIPLEILSKETKIRTKEQNRLNWLFVDEYQDINILQHYFIKYLLKKGTTLNVVGDPDQAIYGFRGSDTKLILGFPQNFEGANVVHLVENYRSAQNIIYAANGVIQHNKMRIDTNMTTHQDVGEKVFEVEADSDDAESYYIVKEIKNFIRRGDFEYKDIAILYRTNAQSRQYEDALMREEIPYVVLKGTSFYKRKEIADILAILRSAFTPKDSTALERVITFGLVGVGTVRLNMFRKWIEKSDVPYDSAENYWNYIINNAEDMSSTIRESFKKYAEHMVNLITLEKKHSIHDMIHYIIANMKYGEYLQAYSPDTFKSRLLCILELESILKPDNFMESLAAIALLSDENDEDKEDHNKVKLLTVHTAKGLEFPVVFMVGMEENLFPFYYSAYKEEDVEEERRVCYVGMTRAMNRLYMTHANCRSIFGKMQMNDGSRFLDEIPYKNKRKFYCQEAIGGFKIEEVKCLPSIEEQISEIRLEDDESFAAVLTKDINKVRLNSSNNTFTNIVVSNDTPKALVASDESKKSKSTKKKSKRRSKNARV